MRPADTVMIVAREDEPDEPVRVTRFTAGSTEYAVLSYSVDEPVYPDVLTAAERDVCRHILSGAANREIAARRSCSHRTVANQVATILRKLGISSRAQLPLALSRAGSPKTSSSGR